MYNLVKNKQSIDFGVVKQGGPLFIPFDPANTDYQAFKQDLANGVALSDAEGTAMTADQIAMFLANLP